MQLTKYASGDINIKELDGTVLSPNSKLVFKQWNIDPHDELLIDAYARQYCNIQLFLFSKDIKQLIALYYSKKYSKSNLKQLIDNRMKREDSYGEMCCGLFVIALINLFFAATAIAAIIIAIQYYNDDESVCDGHYSVIDPVEFVLIAGIALLCLTGYNLIYLCFTWLICNLRNNCLNLRKCKEIISIPSSVISCLISCLMITFYCIWLSIGFYVYVNEMSSECQSSMIGEIMLAWCIVMVLSFFCLWILALCPCVFGLCASDSISISKKPTEY
eukprot:155342_1